MSIPAYYSKNERILRALWLRASSEGELRVGLPALNTAFHVKTSLYRLKRKALEPATLDPELNAVTELYGVAVEQKPPTVIIRVKKLEGALEQLAEGLGLSEQEVWGSLDQQSAAMRGFCARFGSGPLVRGSLERSSLDQQSAAPLVSTVLEPVKPARKAKTLSNSKNPFYNREN